MAKPSKVQPKATSKPATPPRKVAAKKKPKPWEPPSSSTVIRAMLKDLTSPLSQADAAELFGARVIDITRLFDQFWFRLIVDLVTGVVKQCDERDIKATLLEIADAPDGMQFNLLRRRINRNLPVGTGESKLTETERYELARGILVAACDTVKDEELWDALWGRKTDWSPVVTVDKEPVDSSESEPT